MKGSVDELAHRWRSSPDASGTIALADALRTSPRASLVEELGTSAARDFADDASVLTAVARMYMAAQRLGDAQTALIAAGKAAPRAPDVYRWLGEVLLRRGDAERAVKVLERAMQLGAKDGETRLWMERAKVFRTMQATAGMRAVATEIARTAPAEPPRAPLASESSETVTQVRNDFRAPSLGGPDEDEDDELTRRPAPIPAEVNDLSVTAPRPPAHSIQTGTNVLAPPLGPPDEQSVTARFDQLRDGPPTKDAFVPIAAPPPPPAPPRDPFASSMKGPGPAPVIPRPMTPLMPMSDRAPVAIDARDVLDALELAGIFSPHEAGAGPLAPWDRVEKRRARGSVSLVVALIALVGVGCATFFYIRDRRAKEHARAEALLGDVDGILHNASSADLAKAETEIGTAFDLDSRSPHAALLWLRERALRGLLKGGSEIAFEDGMARAKEVGVKESDVAFAQIASFLFQGDTVGAAALLPKWDEVAGKDAWYQLVAGAALARAGDTRAADRFDAAAKIDPGLVLAQMELVRSMALEGDPAKAMERAKALEAKLPNRPEAAALVALAWGRDPARRAAPPEVMATATAVDLPSPLAVIPHALAAMKAIDARATDDAKQAIDRGLAVADGPGFATWLGLIALDAGDEALARKSALAAVSFSAVYPPARMLAARVAVVGDRLDEALKATEELDASSPDVAIVRGVVAYERLDSDGLARSLEGVPDEAQHLPMLAGVVAAQGVLSGRGAGPAVTESPWSDLVAMDSALDTGDLASADAIAEKWKTTDERPLRALRLARLARYEGRLEDADAYSQSALAGTVTPRVLIERVLTLVARGKADTVGPLLAKYPLVLGPLGSWLGAFASASMNRIDEARARTATIDPPPELAPLPARMVAAVALAAMHDRKRATEILKPILQSGGASPDATSAALAVGFKKAQRGTKTIYLAP